MRKFFIEVLDTVFTADYTAFFVAVLMICVAAQRDYGFMVWIAIIPAIILDVFMQRKVVQLKEELK